MEKNIEKLSSDCLFQLRSLQILPPAGFKFVELNAEKDARTINETNPYRREGDLESIRYRRGIFGEKKFPIQSKSFLIAILIVK